MTALGSFVLAVGFPSATRAADPPKYGADGGFSVNLAAALTTR